MNDPAFFHCEAFLRQQIVANPDSAELVKAYVSLLQCKTDFDKAYFSQNAEVQKSWNTNQMEVHKQWQKTQEEIAKKQIDAGYSTPSGQVRI